MPGQNEFVPEAAVEQTCGIQLSQRLHGIYGVLFRLSKISVDHVGVDKNACLLESAACLYD